jgi:DNA-binding transcriptional ArsR family regulator
MTVLTEIKETETEILPGDVPVTMPELPPRLVLTTMAHFKAMSDPMRARILAIILNEPATAKQLATRLGATPGAIGHHLHVLEEAGLAQVVARRLVRGIVAKYYTRTARLFVFDMPPDVTGPHAMELDLLTRARDELAETLTSTTGDPCREASFVHVRLTPERALVYQARLTTLIDDLLQEPQNAEGTVYGLALALFESPPYLQRAAAGTDPA